MFVELIESVRQKEISALLVSNTMRGLNEAIFFCCPIVIAYITFVTLSRTGGELSTSKIFVVMSLFAILQFDFTKFFALAVMAFSETFVALRRMSDFLIMPVDGVLLISDGSSSTSSSSSTSGGGSTITGSGDAGGSVDNKNNKNNYSIVFDGVTAQWGDEGESDDMDIEAAATDTEGENEENKATNKATGSTIPMNKDMDKKGGNQDVLSDLTLTVKPGELVVVVGAVGCSKSSLLMAILGELNVTKGSVKVVAEQGEEEGKGNANANVSVSPSFAYCAQEPWIMSSTLKANGTFFSRASVARMRHGYHILSRSGGGFGVCFY